MKGTLALSWGPSGGFYLHPHRICLGPVALTYVPKLEIDDLMIAWADGRDRTWREQVPADYRDRIDL